MTKVLKSALQDPAQNRILGALPKSDLERLLPDLELVELRLGWIISDSGDHVNFVYFPTSGIVTLMYDLEDGTTSEVALVGNEGMVGISIFMGGDSMPGSVHVQSEGYAFRLSRKNMKREFEMNGKLQHLALLYTQALICQTSQTAMCNKHHSVEQQFCRWLLMSIDRLHEKEMVITHVLVSTLLGVSRESVVHVTKKLKSDGLIADVVGSIKVLDRRKLEVQVCECYETVKKEYDRLLPHPKHSL